MHWLDYQVDWLNDKSQIKIWEKSRRIGATYVQSFEDVEDCVLKTVESVWFSSKDESASREYIRYCEMWSKALNIACSNLGQIVIDPDKDIKAFSLEFKNGTRINALTSNPSQFRSKGGKIVIDEFAHHENPQEMWRAASPSGVVWQAPIRILSTHNGTENLFNQFIKDCKSKKANWSLHSVTLESALNRGLFDKINDGLIKKDAKPYESIQEFIDYVKSTCPDDLTWLQEYCCEPRVNLDLLVVKNWSENNVKPVNYLPFIPTPEGTKEIDLHLSCDFNWSPNCWILSHVDRKNKKFYFFKEYSMDLATEDLIKIVLDEYPHPSRIVINGDASGFQRRSSSKSHDYIIIQNELMRRGYNRENQYYKTGKRFSLEVSKSNGDRNARFAAWNNRVRDINNNNYIFVDPIGCPNLIYNCENLKIKPGTSEYDEPTRRQIENNPKLKFLGHALDNAQYCVNKYAPIEGLRNRIPERPLSLIDQWKRDAK